MKSKNKVMVIGVREDLEQAVNDYAMKAAVARGLGAELDVELGKVRERYADRIAVITDAMEPLAEAIEEWAVLHPEEFGDKKSLELVAGKIGFRTTPPSVKTLRGVREESAVERVAKSEHVVAYIRDVQEINREAILADYAAGNVTDDELKNLGLRIHKTETFYIDPHDTEVKP